MSARYLEEIADERYAPQGFHRGSKSACPAKHVLERACAYFCVNRFRTAQDSYGESAIQGRLVP